MKYQRIIGIISVSFVLIFLLLTASFADETVKKDTAAKNGVKFSLGINLWYAWWHAPFDNIRFIKFVQVKASPDIKPTTVFGLILSFKFNPKWDLSAVVMYGKFRAEINSTRPLLNLSLLLPGSDVINLILLSKALKPENFVHRFDFDLTVGYRVNRYVKLFGGLKSQIFQLDFGLVPGIIEVKSRLKLFGPGFGVGFTIPIVSRLYLMPNLSGILMGGTFDGGDAVVAGGNGTLNFAYVVPNNHVTVVLGGRAQYLKFIKMDNPVMSDNRDIFYGVNGSIIYTF